MKYLNAIIIKANYFNNSEVIFVTFLGNSCTFVSSVLGFAAFFFFFKK